MTVPRPLRRGLAAALLTAAAGTSPAWAETREIDPRQVESDALAVRNDRQRMLHRDAETRTRLLMLKAERAEALILGDRRGAEALAQQIRAVRRQAAVHAQRDRTLLTAHRRQLRQSVQGTPVQ